MNDNSECQSSIGIGYNRKDSPWKYDVKVYVDGKEITTIDEARNKAKNEIALLVAGGE